MFKKFLNSRLAAITFYSVGHYSICLHTSSKTFKFVENNVWFIISFFRLYFLVNWNVFWIIPCLFYALKEFFLWLLILFSSFIPSSPTHFQVLFLWVLRNKRNKQSYFSLGVRGMKTKLCLNRLALENDKFILLPCS